MKSASRSNQRNIYRFRTLKSSISQESRWWNEAFSLRPVRAAWILTTWGCGANSPVPLCDTNGRRNGSATMLATPLSAQWRRSERCGQRRGHVRRQRGDALDNARTAFAPTDSDSRGNLRFPNGLDVENHLGRAVNQSKGRADPQRWPEFANDQHDAHGAVRRPHTHWGSAMQHRGRKASRFRKKLSNALFGGSIAKGHVLLICPPSSCPPYLRCYFWPAQSSIDGWRDVDLHCGGASRDSECNKCELSFLLDVHDVMMASTMIFPNGLPRPMWEIASAAAAKGWVLAMIARNSHGAPHRREVVNLRRSAAINSAGPDAGSPKSTRRPWACT